MHIHSTTQTPKPRRVLATVHGRQLAANTLVWGLAALAATLSQPIRAADIVVDSPLDVLANDGLCTLREAFENANAAGQVHTDCEPGGDFAILFDIPGPGPHTITLGYDLPVLTEATWVNGLSQPGASCSEWPREIQIELVAGYAGGTGLRTDRPSRFTGLSVGGFDVAGIQMLDDGRSDHRPALARGGGGFEVFCNYIGVRPDGVTALPNGMGVDVRGDWLARIGGPEGAPSEDQGNLISGNSEFGVNVEAGAGSGIIRDNRVGTDQTGLAVPAGGGGSQEGIRVRARNFWRIDANLVSGNGGGAGVALLESTSMTVQNNLIGLTVSGDAPLPNNVGIRVRSSQVSIRGNVVSGQIGDGISIAGGDLFPGFDASIEGNLIGVGVDGLSAFGNQNGVFTDGPLQRVEIGRPGERLENGNVISGNRGHGVLVRSLNGDITVDNNLVGLGNDGVTHLGNGGFGVSIEYPGVRVGAEAGNVVSSNQAGGIRLAEAAGSQVISNTVGLDASGILERGNLGHGVLIAQSPDALVQSNVVAASTGDGLNVFDSERVSVRGNHIGTDASGSEPRGNLANGVTIVASLDTQIGGPGDGNLIAFNGAQGVQIFQAAVCTGKTLRENGLRSNGGLAIDLVRPGDAPGSVNPNDPGDVDSTANGDGPNNGQNYPEIDSVIAEEAGTLVSGFLNSEPESGYRIELFANSACDPSGFGEGERFLAGADVVTDETGVALLEFLVPPGLVAAGEVVTATATDSGGNSSEFSACVAAATRDVVEVSVLSQTATGVLALLLSLFGVGLVRRMA